jgi:hypothetical protein
MRISRISSLAVIASAGLLVLAGCSASDDTAAPETSMSAPAPDAATGDDDAAAGGEQTVEEACAVANEMIMSVQGEVNEAMSNSTDQEAVIGALESVEARLGEAVDEITNAEVGAALGEFHAQFSEFTTVLTEVQANQEATPEQQEAVQQGAVDLQESVVRMQELCT